MWRRERGNEARAIERDAPQRSRCARHGREAIDARGHVAPPSFLDVHTHCFQSLPKGLGTNLPLIP